MTQTSTTENTSANSSTSKCKEIISLCLHIRKDVMKEEW